MMGFSFIVTTMVVSKGRQVDQLIYYLDFMATRSLLYFMID